MTISTRLIILNVTKIKDNTIVIHCLTRDYGRKSFLVSVGKSASMALYLPLNILDAEIIENPKSDLWRAKNISSVHPLLGIRQNIHKNTMTLFMSEVLYRSISENSIEPGLFQWCEKTILTLEALDSDFANYHLVFLIDYAKTMGFAPSTESIAAFAGQRLQDIAMLLELPLGQAMLVPLKGEVRNEIADILLKYLSFHTDTNIQARSLKVLREIYQ